MENQKPHERRDSSKETMGYNSESRKGNGLLINTVLAGVAVSRVLANDPDISSLQGADTQESARSVYPQSPKGVPSPNDEQNVEQVSESLNNMLKKVKIVKGGGGENSVSESNEINETQYTTLYVDPLDLQPDNDSNANNTWEVGYDFQGKVEVNGVIPGYWNLLGSRDAGEFNEEFGKLNPNVATAYLFLNEQWWKWDPAQDSENFTNESGDIRNAQYSAGTGMWFDINGTRGDTNTTVTFIQNGIPASVVLSPVDLNVTLRPGWNLAEVGVAKELKNSSKNNGTRSVWEFDAVKQRYSYAAPNDSNGKLDVAASDDNKGVWINRSNGATVTLSSGKNQETTPQLEFFELPVPKGYRLVSIADLNETANYTQERNGGLEHLSPLKVYTSGEWHDYNLSDTKNLPNISATGWISSKTDDASLFTLSPSDIETVTMNPGYNLLALPADIDLFKLHNFLSDNNIQNDIHSYNSTTSKWSINEGKAYSAGGYWLDNRSDKNIKTIFAKGEISVLQDILDIRVDEGDVLRVDLKKYFKNAKSFSLNQSSDRVYIDGDVLVVNTNGIQENFSFTDVVVTGESPAGIVNSNNFSIIGVNKLDDQGDINDQTPYAIELNVAGSLSSVGLNKSFTTDPFIISSLDETEEYSLDIVGATGDIYLIDSSGKSKKISKKGVVNNGDNVEVKFKTPGTNSKPFSVTLTVGSEGAAVYDTLSGKTEKYVYTGGSWTAPASNTVVTVTPTNDSDTTGTDITGVINAGAYNYGTVFTLGADGADPNGLVGVDVKVDGTTYVNGTLLASGPHTATATITGVDGAANGGTTGVTTVNLTETFDINNTKIHFNADKNTSGTEGVNTPLDFFTDANTTDAEGNTLQSITLPSDIESLANGKIYVNGVLATNGQVLTSDDNTTLVPNVDFNGTISFDINGSDGDMDSNNSQSVNTVYVNVEDSPVINSVTANLETNESVEKKTITFDYITSIINHSDADLGAGSEGNITNVYLIVPNKGEYTVSFTAGGIEKNAGDVIELNNTVTSFDINGSGLDTVGYVEFNASISNDYNVSNKSNELPIRLDLKDVNMSKIDSTLTFNSVTPITLAVGAPQQHTITLSEGKMLDENNLTRNYVITDLNITHIGTNKGIVSVTLDSFTTINGKGVLTFTLDALRASANGFDWDMLGFYARQEGDKTNNEVNASNGIELELQKFKGQ